MSGMDCPLVARDSYSWSLVRSGMAGERLPAMVIDGDRMCVTDIAGVGGRSESGG